MLITHASPPTSLTTGNLLLDALRDEQRAGLGQQLELVSLSPGQVIYETGDAIQQIYFPIDSVICSLVIMEDGATIETSMMGRECLTGIEAIMGRGAAMHWTRVMIGGTALRIGTQEMKKAFNAHGSVQEAVMRACRMLITQISQRAVCNARHKLINRFCCWLLMVRDRVCSNNLPLTQEAIAGHLGARRASITGAARALLAMQAIEYKRGHLHIRDSRAVEGHACECYEVHRAEFASLAPKEMKDDKGNFSAQDWRKRGVQAPGKGAV